MNTEIKKQYKELIINSLYGMMDGSPKSLVEHIIYVSKINLGVTLSAVMVTASSTDKFINNAQSRPCWYGTMTVKLVIDGAEYELTRDWSAERDIDILHEDYETDDWFFESDKCASYKISKALLAELVD
jgi:hypothetical protein